MLRAWHNDFSSGSTRSVTVTRKDRPVIAHDRKRDSSSLAQLHIDLVLARLFALEVIHELVFVHARP